MEISRFFMTIGIAALTGGQSLVAQGQKDDSSGFVKELIESGEYTVNVVRALPMSGRTVNLTSPYSLEIRGDSVFSHLPYFGRAYSVPYGGGDGLRFAKPVTDYNVSFDKKDRAEVSFKTHSDDDSYTFNLQVFSNGSATLFVQPTNRQSITFHGDLSREVKEE